MKGTQQAPTNLLLVSVARCRQCWLLIHRSPPLYTTGSTLFRTSSVYLFCFSSTVSVTLKNFLGGKKIIPFKSFPNLFSPQHLSLGKTALAWDLENRKWRDIYRVELPTWRKQFKRVFQGSRLLFRKAFKQHQYMHEKTTSSCKPSQISENVLFLIKKRAIDRKMLNIYILESATMILSKRLFVKFSIILNSKTQV